MRTLRQACCQEIPGSAMCVQNLDDSRGLAIRITYRISLRSSSLWEPRHPLLKVVIHFFNVGVRCATYPSPIQILVFCRLITVCGSPSQGPSRGRFQPEPIRGKERFWTWCGNDPSAGSPTETLLRLHLPLNDKV